MFIKRLVQNFLMKFEYELKLAAQPIYIGKDHIGIIKDKIAGYTMLPHSRLVGLADQIAYCNKANVPGSFVECGVWKGGAVALMAHASMASGRTDRNLHLFDAFQDICAPDPEVDGAKAIAETQGFGQHVAGEATPLKGIYDRFGGHGSVDACREVIISRIGYPERHVHFHIGWFQDTVFADATALGPIALLRLDGDWYESTKVCLDALFDNVVPGGIIVFDDYLTYDGCRKAVDEFLQLRNITPMLIRGDSSCYFMIKQ